MFGKLISSTLILFTGLSYAELDPLDQLQKQAASVLSSVLSGANSAGPDSEAAEYLLGKFKLDQEGKPNWYPKFYPLPSEMEPASEVKPRIHLFKPVSEGQTLLAPILEVFRKKNGTGGSCESNFINLNPTYKSFGSIAGTEYCMEGAKEFTVDKSTLASIEKLSTLSDETATQSAFISVLNMEALSDSQKNQLMTDPNASIKTILDSLASDKDKQALFDPRPIRFNKYIADPGHPFKLGAIQAQVGTMSVDIPMSAPPSPQCTIQVLTPQPVNLNQQVQFNILANSVVRGGSIRLDNEKQSVFDLDNLVNNPTSQIGSFVKVNSSPLTMTFTQEDKQDIRIIKFAVPGNPSQQMWIIKGSVYGVNASERSECTPTEIIINTPLPPDCTLTVAQTQLLKGESTTATLDCSAGGPVRSVVVKGYSNPIMQQDGSSGSRTGLVSGRNAENRTQIGPVRDLDLSGNTTKVFTFQHTKTEVVAGETIVATVTGPQESKDFSAALGDVCPYNETTFSRTEFQTNELFRTLGSSTGYAKGELKFTNGRLNYQSNGLFFRSEGAISPSNLIAGCVNNQNGNWAGCWGDGVFETCDGNNICMMIGHMTDSNYNSYTAGSHIYWIEVGKADGTDGGKYDPACKVQKTRMRFGGCFAKDTRLQLADGSYRKVTEILETDSLWNPHYQAPVKIKKIVKGPEKKSLYEVKTSEGKVEVTEDHPFLTGRGWVQTMELKTGDKLLGNGKPKLVSQVKKLKYHGPQDVWNFELDSEDPMAHVVIANGVPTGDLVTQLELKKPKAKLP